VQGPRIGCLGGTFDPVHDGHLTIAEFARSFLCLDEMRLIPVAVPVHRNAPFASIDDRLTMLRLALHDHPGLCVDEREIRSSSPNYTLHTLQSLKSEMPQASLFWVVGEDAFALLPIWHRWQELFDYAHFVVATRLSENIILPDFAVDREAPDHHTSYEQTAGLVFRLPFSPHPASSSAIRAAIADHHAERIQNLLPEPVLSYIAQKNLYLNLS
jgi:nicotinate-nucleotide adenylyltransferase